MWLKMLLISPFRIFVWFILASFRTAWSCRSPVWTTLWRLDSRFFVRLLSRSLAVVLFSPFSVLSCQMAFTRDLVYSVMTTHVLTNANCYLLQQFRYQINTALFTNRAVFPTLNGIVCDLGERIWTQITGCESEHASFARLFRKWAHVTSDSTFRVTSCNVDSAGQFAQSFPPLVFILTKVRLSYHPPPNYKITLFITCLLLKSRVCAFVQQLVCTSRIGKLDFSNREFRLPWLKWGLFTFTPLLCCLSSFRKCWILYFLRCKFRHWKTITYRL